MATVDEVVIRLTFQQQNQAVLPQTATALKGVETATKSTDTAIKSLVTSQDRANKSLNNTRDAIIKTSLATSSFSGELGKAGTHALNLTNQIENFEFASKRAGNNVSILSMSLTDASASMGKLGVAGLAVSSAMIGWKIGTWINETTGLGKALDNLTQSSYAWITPLTGMAAKLEEMNGPTKEQEQTLAALNNRLKEQLWDKYGIAVDTARMSIIEANNALLQAATAVNSVTAAQGNAINKIAAAADQAQIRIQKAFMTTEQLLQQNLARQEDLTKKMEKSISPKWVDMYAEQIAGLKLEAAGLEIALIKEAEAQKKSTAAKTAAVPKVKALKDSFDGLLIPLGKVPFALDALAPSLERLNQISASSSLVNVLPGSTLELTQNLDLLAPALESSAQSGMTFDEAVKMMADSTKELSGQVPPLIKQLAGLANALGQISGIFNELANITGSDTIGAIGLAFQGGAKAATGLGQIMSGDILGGIQSLISAAGDLFNAFKKVFSHDWAEDVERTINNFLPGLELSAEMMEQLAQAAEEAGDAMVGAFLSLKAIMDDVGVSAENVNIFVAELRNGFSLLESDAITANQLIEVLDATFADLAEASTDSLGLISAEFREIIALAKQFGLESAAITGFINSQLSGVAGGVNQVAGNTNITKQAGFDRLQTQVLTAFNAMIANGATAQEAMAALGPSFDVLNAAMEKFGFNANKALDPLLEMMRLADQFPKQFAVLEGVNAQLVGLSNTGNLSKDAFKALEKEAGRAFRKIMQDGKASRGELQAMAPTLALLEKLAAEQGITLSKNNQALIDQARAYGLLTDPAADMQSTLDNLNTTLENLTTSVDGFTAALLGIPSNVSTTITTDYVSGTPTAGPVPYTGGGGTGWSPAGGGTQQQQAQPQRLTMSVEIPIDIDAKIMMDGTKVANLVFNKLERREVTLNIGNIGDKLIVLK